MNCSFGDVVAQPGRRRPRPHNGHSPHVDPRADRSSSFDVWGDNRMADPAVAAMAFVARRAWRPMRSSRLGDQMGVPQPAGGRPSLGAMCCIGSST